jgi:hypothetical protein
MPEDNNAKYKDLKLIQKQIFLFLKGGGAFPPQLTLRLKSWGIHTQYFDENKSVPN